MFLGIDLGTSSVKAVVLDENERIAAQASAPLGVQRPQPLWSEQNPEEWWHASVEAVRALPAEIRKAVRGIGLSGQMHGAVLLDAKDQVLRPAILWNDGRCETECVELEQAVPESRQITGNLAMPGFTAPKLLWVKKHEPEIFAKTTSVLLPKDYLRLKLTGEKISDMSDSAGTLWLDVEKRQWSDAMLKATGLNKSHMPSLVEGTQPAGKLRPDVASLLGLDAVVVAGGGGDNAASAVGSGVIAPGQAFLSLGTSGVLFVVTDKFRPNPEKAAHAFCHAIPNRWHQMSVMLSAASALDWAVNVGNLGNVVSATQAAQEVGLKKTTPIFLPYLSGERTPHNDPFARGVFFHLSAETSGADLINAVLEGVALGFAEGLDSLVEAGSDIAEINVVGGGSRLNYWNELLASALNRPLIRRTGGEIGAAFGAARLGRIAVTNEDPRSVCIAPPIERVIAPNEELSELMRRRRPAFAAVYRQLKSVFREFSI
jgi:xylulokinase